MQRLTQHAGVNYLASGSLDGKQILFDSTRDRNLEICVTDADGPNVRRLTQHEAVDARPTAYRTKPKSPFTQDVITRITLKFT